MSSLERIWESEAKPHQQLFFDLDRYCDDGPDTPKLVAGIVTGYGGGKTWAGVRKMFQLAIENAPIPVLCVEPTYQMIADILVPAFEDLFEEYGIEYTHNQQRKEFRIQYLRIAGKTYFVNAKIWMRSGDRPERLKGPNLAAAWIDEPFVQDRDVYKQVVARVRHPRATNKMLLFTGTPEGLGWGYDEFAKQTTLARTVNTVIRDQSVPVHVYEGDGMIWVNCSSEINIDALGAGYFADIKRTHTELEAGAYIHGTFQNLSQGRVYYAYTSDNDGTEEQCELDLNAPVIVTCDFNATEAPMSWNIMQLRDGVLRVRKAMYKAFTNTPRMCDELATWFKETYGRLPHMIDFYGDYAGNKETSNSTVSDWQIIETYFANQCRVSIHKKPCRSIRQSAAAVNAMLYNAEHRRRLLLYPGEETEHLRMDFELVTWKEGSTKEDDSDIRRTHAAAAMRYYCDYEFPIMQRAERVN